MTQRLHVTDQPEHQTVAQRNAHNAGLAEYSSRPIAFLYRYIRQHPFTHLAVLISVFTAVGCALASQYAIKHLIDVLSLGRGHPQLLWTAFLLLVGLIAADNLSWRVGGRIAAHAFVAVTGDLRRELFRYLSGHSPTYFSEKQPGTLASRITATSNAIYIAENTMAWNVLPPVIAVAGAIVMISIVNPLMAGCLMLTSLILACILYKLAGRGTARHHTFAAKAAAVDGELVDVIGNMGLVRAFALSRKIASAARVSDRHAVRSPARLGLDPMAARPGHLGRYRPGEFTGLHDFAWHARSCGSAG